MIRTKGDMDRASFSLHMYKKYNYIKYLHRRVYFTSLLTWTKNFQILNFICVLPNNTKDYSYMVFDNTKGTQLLIFFTLVDILP